VKRAWCMSRDSSRGDQGFNFQMREREREAEKTHMRERRRGREGEREEKMQRHMRKKEDGEERENERLREETFFLELKKYYFNDIWKIKRIYCGVYSNREVKNSFIT